MAFLLSPICNEQQSDSNGAPLAGGTISTYLGGTSTPAPTYTDITGGTPQTNPIVLNSHGFTPSPIWLDSSIVYKFIIKDSLGNVQRTIDNITGVSNSVPVQNEWVVYGSPPTFLGATSLSVTGDQTAAMHVGRRVRTTNTAGVIYSTITASSFAAGVTTLTLANDSGALDAGLSQLSYGLLSFTNYSFAPIVKGSITMWFQAAAPIGWTQVVTHNDKALRIVNDGTGGGAGGSVAFSTAFASKSVVGTIGSTTLTLGQVPPHAHGIGSLSNTVSGGGNTISGSSTSTAILSGDGSAGGLGGGSHTHSFTGTAIDLTVQYINMILASKN